MMTLDQALVAINERKDFIANRYDGLVSINYLIQMPDSFDGLRRNLRGTTFDEKTGGVVSLPLHKFMNVNQTVETQWDIVKDQDGDVYEKVDGSMIHFFAHRGELRAATRMSSETTQAKQAFKLAEKLGLLPDIVRDVKLGSTPAFEYVGPENLHVVEYKKPRLIYLTSRLRCNGYYTQNPSFRDSAQKHDFRFSEIMEKINVEGAEGFVCRLRSGLWVKCKTPWYLSRQHVADVFMRPVWCLYEIALDGKIDDLIANAPAPRKPLLESIWREVSSDVLNEKQRIETLSKMTKAMTPNRKAYVECVQRRCNNDFALMMTAYDGKDLSKGVAKQLLERYKKEHPNRLVEAGENDGEDA